MKKLIKQPVGTRSKDGKDDQQDYYDAPPHTASVGTPLAAGD